jgi:hypothetical protein
MSTLSKTMLQMEEHGEFAFAEELCFPYPRLFDSIDGWQVKFLLAGTQQSSASQQTLLAEWILLSSTH